MLTPHQYEIAMKMLMEQYHWPESIAREELSKWQILAAVTDFAKEQTRPSNQASNPPWFANPNATQGGLHNT